MFNDQECDIYANANGAVPQVMVQQRIWYFDYVPDITVKMRVVI
jgi:hypothetical protein